MRLGTGLPFCARGFTDWRVAPRRRGERRAEAHAVPQDRRGGRERRTARDRRETPSAHLRNAIQAMTIARETSPPPDVAELLEVACFRAWLAVLELERASRSAPAPAKEDRPSQGR